MTVGQSVNVDFWHTCSLWAGTCTTTTCTAHINSPSSYSSTAAMRRRSMQISTNARRIFIQYAHNCLADPHLQIELPAVRHRCDISTAPVVYPSLYPFLQGNMQRKNVLSTQAKVIKLLDNSQADVATSAWHATKLDFRSGFSTTFRIETASNR